MVAVGSSGIGPADLRRKLQRALGPGYELAERIGAGGFAEVFQARDLRLKRELAVKVLRPDLGLSPDLLQRFRREAETVAALRNAHIVPVFDVGEAEGLAYIIMPLIQGESLRAVLDRDGAMPVPEVRRILREASQGLAAAHDAGIIHRDIKPENIMLEGRDKRVLLMDFGIAKAMGAATGEEGDPSVALTTTGIIIGTPQYMSPEQACGDKTIDARTDQYSLAVVAYRMLTGALPFDGESTRAVLYQQLVADPQPIIEKLPNLPGGLSNAIQRALSKEPNDRFPSMREFGEMLDSESTVVIPASTAARPKATRRGLMIGVGVTGAVALGALFMLTRPSSAPDTAAAVGGRRLGHGGLRHIARGGRHSDRRQQVASRTIPGPRRHPPRDRPARAGSRHRRPPVQRRHRRRRALAAAQAARARRKPETGRRPQRCVSGRRMPATRRRSESSGQCTTRATASPRTRRRQWFGTRSPRCRMRNRCSCCHT